MMMLSEKTAYKAVAFAARHKWAKPFCFGVYSAVYAAEKLKADESRFQGGSSHLPQPLHLFL